MTLISDLATFLNSRLDEDEVDAKFIQNDDYFHSIQVVFPVDGITKPHVVIAFDQRNKTPERGMERWSRDNASRDIQHIRAVRALISSAKRSEAATPNESATGAYKHALLALVQRYRGYPGYDRGWSL